MMLTNIGSSLSIIAIIATMGFCIVTVKKELSTWEIENPTEVLLQKIRSRFEKTTAAGQLSDYMEGVRSGKFIFGLKRGDTPQDHAVRCLRGKLRLNPEDKPTPEAIANAWSDLNKTKWIDNNLKRGLDANSTTCQCARCEDCETNKAPGQQFCNACRNKNCCCKDPKYPNMHGNWERKEHRKTDGRKQCSCTAGKKMSFKRK